MIICNCNVISDKDVKEYIQKNAETLEAMPSNKATANIFNNLRPKTSADGKNPCDGCLQPCISRIESLLIEAEAERDKGGYSTPSERVASDIMDSFLFGIK